MLSEKLLNTGEKCQADKFRLDFGENNSISRLQTENLKNKRVLDHKKAMKLMKNTHQDFIDFKLNATD